MRRVVSVLSILAIIYFALNIRWVQAFAVASTAPSCPAQVTDLAAQRVQAFFGDTLSAPMLRCPEQPRLGLGQTIGTTHFAPGLPAIIILNPEGAVSVDVVAHEWAHAEIAARTNTLHRTYILPTWFDEGLAMQVDHRSGYNTAALARLLAQTPAPPLANIASTSTFFAAAPKGTLHYAYARCVVGRWILENPSWGDALDTIKEGEFEVAAQRCARPDTTQ